MAVKNKQPEPGAFRSIAGKPTTKRRRAAMQAATYFARKNRRTRVQNQSGAH